MPKSLLHKPNQEDEYEVASHFNRPNNGRESDYVNDRRDFNSGKGSNLPRNLRSNRGAGNWPATWEVEKRRLINNIQGKEIIMAEHVEEIRVKNEIIREKDRVIEEKITGTQLYVEEEREVCNC